MNDEVLELVPSLASLFEGHKRRCVRESLSLLYVAMTRAKQGLYMLVNAPQINKGGSISKVGLKSPAGILRSALAAGKSDPGKVHFSRGDSKWIEQVKSSEEITVDAPAGRIELAKPRDDARARRGWAHAAASSLPADSRLGKELRLPNLDSRERGLAIHAMFQQIEWIENFTASDDELARIALVKAPRRTREWAARQAADFRRMIKHKQVRAALSRPPAASTTQLERERPFARLIDGRIQTGFIDRLVIERDKVGLVVRAAIYDFKTDDPSDTAAAATMAETYRPQLETYRAAAAGMHHVDPATVTMHLVFVEPGLVIGL